MSALAVVAPTAADDTAAHPDLSGAGPAGTGSTHAEPAAADPIGSARTASPRTAHSFGVAVPTAQSRPVPSRRAARHPRRGGSTRPGSVGAAPVAAESSALDLAASALLALGTPAVGSSGMDPSVGPVTVTISLAAGESVQRGRVLTALRELIEAAGPDAAVAMPVVRSGGSVDALEPSVVLDPLPRTVLLDGTPLELSRLEYDLLLFLAEHPRQVFSRSQLLSQVWGHTHTSARTIDVHVSRLRTKLGPDRDAITTVYGLGYRLADDVPLKIIRR